MFTTQKVSTTLMFVFVFKDYCCAAFLLLSFCVENFFWYIDDFATTCCCNNFADGPEPATFSDPILASI